MKSIIKKSNANNKRTKKRVTFKDHRRRHSKKQTNKIQWGGDITEDDIKNLEDDYNSDKITSMYNTAKDNINKEERLSLFLDLDRYLDNGVKKIDDLQRNNPTSVFFVDLEKLKTDLTDSLSRVRVDLDIEQPPFDEQQFKQQLPPQYSDVQQSFEQPQLPPQYSYTDPSLDGSITKAVPVYPLQASYASDSNSVTGNTYDITTPQSINKQKDGQSTPISDASISPKDFDALVKDIKTQTENIICLLLLVLEKKKEEENNEEITKVIQEINSKISSK